MFIIFYNILDDVFHLIGTLGNENQCLPFKIPTIFADSLKNCFWPGRSHVLKKSNKLIYFLDSAHTPQSIKV